MGSGARQASAQGLSLTRLKRPSRHTRGRHARNGGPSCPVPTSESAQESNMAAQTGLH